MQQLKAWIKACRLRTLPLAFSTIIMGTALAAYFHYVSVGIFVLSLSTTLFLQILSNLANDYGDFVKGTDNNNRQGPERALQSGIINKEEMKWAIIIFSLLAFTSGIALLILSFEKIISYEFITFVLLGLACIFAAITYTIGKSAYGYNSLGDLFVFVFFGIVGVMGSYFLYVKEFNVLVFLPASSIGLLSAGVLNVNNMRDIENDKASAKHTLAVKLGIESAKNYHLIIVCVALINLLIFDLLQQAHIDKYFYVLLFPLFVLHILKIHKASEPLHLDKQLKPLALSTFVLSVVFAISHSFL
jgi:1,4-dihydroxy-2-naphthoate octaprenyltransferase